jgi:formylglycine-generating enzyme required for sulfatase activity
MAQMEVTQAQYRQITGANPSLFKGDDLPVETVSWEEAVAFCRKLTDREGFPYGLPTEAQWEYACRAGTTTPFNTGQIISTDQANYDGDHTYGNGRKGIDPQKTREVGGLAPNAFGLYDMHGNVWEWCSDWYDEKYYAGSPGVDPSGPSGGATYRVLRGGSWNYNPGICRSANRDWITPNLRYSNVGFRIVLLDFQ